MRTCTRCGTVKQLELFSGRHSWCKRCQADYARCRYHHRPDPVGEGRTHDPDGCRARTRSLLDSINASTTERLAVHQCSTAMLAVDWALAPRGGRQGDNVPRVRPPLDIVEALRLPFDREVVLLEAALDLARATRGIPAGTRQKLAA